MQWLPESGKAKFLFKLANWQEHPVVGFDLVQNTLSPSMEMKSWPDLGRSWDF